jgi:hypothetical protein
MKKAVALRLEAERLEREERQDLYEADEAQSRKLFAETSQFAAKVVAKELARIKDPRVRSHRFKIETDAPFKDLHTARWTEVFRLLKKEKFEVECEHQYEPASESKMSYDTDPVPFPAFYRTEFVLNW